RFSSGTTHAPAETSVATTTILGTLDGTFPLKPGVSPDLGVGPGAVIASDNTLGSFSPYQGRLYISYVDRSTATGNPADNTDIWLAVSDDGGATWAAHSRINDDNAATDGFSEASDAPSVRGRPQFMPSVAVD